MKKIICILAVAVLLSAVALGFLVKRHKHTVSNFSLLPCDISNVVAFSIEADGETASFEKNNQHWKMISPYSEFIEPGAEESLNRFLSSKIYVDDIRDCSEASCEKLKAERSVKIEFKRSDADFCAFELGNGSKLGTYDAERRWVFIQNKAYRAFVPMLDFGPLFEQPTAGWRNRMALQLGMNEIQRIEVKTPGESYELDKSGVRSEHNPQGWRVKSAVSMDKPLPVEGFNIDGMRVATLIELVTPFYVDDWKKDDEFEATGGQLIFHTAQGDKYIEIGPALADNSKEAKWIGAGARYIRVDHKVGLISMQRLSGIFPSINDLRSKRVWDLDTQKLARIEVVSHELCRTYRPKDENGWTSFDCDNESSSTPIAPEKLGKFARALQYLEAYRFVSEDENVAFEPIWEIKLYEGKDAQISYILKLSDRVKEVSRYAQLYKYENGNPVIAAPTFVLSENVAGILISAL